MTTLDIHGLSSGGDGVGRLEDGRTVFVPGTWPGDRAKILTPSSKEKLVRGTLVHLVDASSERIASRCEREACGGCTWRAFDPGAQRRSKATRLFETMRRIGGVEIEIEPIDAPELDWAYRHRCRLHARYDDTRWELGYFERNSHDVVALDGCPVLWPELEQTCDKIADLIRELPGDVLLREVEVAYSRRDKAAVAQFRLDGDDSVLRNRFASSGVLAGFEVKRLRGRRSHGNLKLRYDHARADEWDLRFEPGVFTQAYPAVNDALVRRVLQLVRPGDGLRVLELHAGVGNFSIPLARAGASVVAVEEVPRAATMGRRNAVSAGVSVEVRAMLDVAALDGTPYDVLLMDPPRTGARSVARHIERCPVERIVYVSCDPATLARDVGELVKRGFKVESVHAFDMFPQTPHVEAVAHLRRVA